LKIGKFCISQANIPSRIYDYILKIADNNALQERIDVKVKSWRIMGNDATKTNKMESSRASPEVRRLTECIEEMRGSSRACLWIRSISTRFSTSIWNGVEIVKTAFVPEIDDEIKAVMGLGVDTYLKSCCFWASACFR
jgi:hypothetical protein